MKNTNRWAEGFIINMVDENEKYIIRRVIKKQVTLVKISSGKSQNIEKSILDKACSRGEITFMAESKCNGEMHFNELSEMDQIETCRRLRYVKKYYELNIKKKSIFSDDFYIPKK